MQDSIFNLLTEEQLRGRNTLKWNYFGPDVVPLWLAEMDFPTAPAVLDGVRACVDNEEFGYPPLGEDSLPRATADWCRQRYGWCPRPDWVRVVPDVLKGMEVVVRRERPTAFPEGASAGLRRRPARSAGSAAGLACGQESDPAPVADARASFVRPPSGWTGSSQRAF